MHETPVKRKGRGAVSNRGGRFDVVQRIDVDDGWRTHLDPESGTRTCWHRDSSRTVITRNQSPDVPFDRSVNPYRGCEHGCVYCFARPSHAWLGHSAGLDFERLLYAKLDAPQQLRNELGSRSYQVEPIALGVNTDAYQPLERQLGLTRKLLEVLHECEHPVYLITKSSLIERDIDLLSDMARRRLVTASVSITTLDHDLARRLEPRATSPTRRLRTLKTLSEAGIPTRLSLAPMIPVLNEPEIESLVEASAEAGAKAATMTMLRLPHELATLFPEWLREHYPLRAERVLKAIRSMRREGLNDAEFGTRMRGHGPRAELMHLRFRRACQRAGVAHSRELQQLDHGLRSLDCSRFRSPARESTDTPQLALFR